MLTLQRLVHTGTRAEIPEIPQLLLPPPRGHLDDEQMTCGASPPKPANQIFGAADERAARRQGLNPAISAPILSSHHPHILPAEISKRVPVPVKKGKARVLRKDGSPHRA